MEKKAVVFIEIGGKPVPAGVIRIEEEGRYSRARFAYGRGYLERPDAVAIDPVQLPLGEESYETPTDWAIFNGLRDASPDAWGRKLIERFVLGYQGHPAGEAEFLLMSQSGNRAGALQFGPTPKAPGPVLDLNLPDHLVNLGDLESFQEMADRISRDEQIPEALSIFIAPGSDMGGMRPKGTVMRDGFPWLAKFGKADDRINMAAAEAGCLDLCEMAGLEVCEREVIDVAGRPALLVKRFDRELHDDGGLRRRHMLSSMTLLGAHETDRSMHGYADIHNALRRLGAPGTGGEEVFRRMVMNVLCGNTDDHYRNHGFLLGDRGYEMSPVYDVTPTLQASPTRHMFFHLGKPGAGRVASLEACVAAAPAFGMDDERAIQIVNDLSGMVATRWRDVMKLRGASEYDIEMMAQAFSLAGRRLEEPGADGPPGSNGP